MSSLIKDHYNITNDINIGINLQLVIRNSYLI